MRSKNTRLIGVVKMALLTVGLAVGAIGASPYAQGSTRTVLHSGLHSFFPRHVVRLTVAEVGDVRTASRVLIQFRDARDRIVASTAGVLRRGQPVQLDMRVDDADVAQFRASVEIDHGAVGRSSPVTTLEDIDVDSFAIIPKVVCGPPSGKSDPQAYCPGWEATSFAQ